MTGPVRRRSVAECQPEVLLSGAEDSAVELFWWTFRNSQRTETIRLEFQNRKDARPSDEQEITVSTTTLNLATPSTRHSKRPASISAEKFAQLTVVEQVRQAFQPGGRLAAVIGLLLGSSIPAMTFCLVHFVLPHYPDDRIVLWVIAVGGLAYSAPKVFRWGVSAWGSTFEAAGMVLLLEGIMTFVPGVWLPMIALLVVVFINGVYSACRLQIRN